MPVCSAAHWRFYLPRNFPGVQFSFCLKIRFIYVALPKPVRSAISSNDNSVVVKKWILTSILIFNIYFAGVVPFLHTLYFEM